MCAALTNPCVAEHSCGCNYSDYNSPSRTLLPCLPSMLLSPTCVADHCLCNSLLPVHLTTARVIDAATNIAPHGLCAVHAATSTPRPHRQRCLLTSSSRCLNSTPKSEQLQPPCCATRGSAMRGPVGPSAPPALLQKGSGGSTSDPGMLDVRVPAHLCARLGDVCVQVYDGGGA